MTGRHRCEFTHDIDPGVEIVTDNVVHPLSELRSEFDRAKPASESVYKDDLNGWDRIYVHPSESAEGITSGHVYKLVDGGLIEGCILILW